jgi:CHAD domain-containing protein
LRIGLRRLRSALRLFELDEALAALDAAAAALFDRLGGARDRVVFAAEFGALLRAAMQEAGLADLAPATGPSVEDGAGIDAAIRETASQFLLLDLIDCRHAGWPADAPPDPADLKDRMERRLRGWHRTLAADAQRFEQLDDEGRHRLRRRAKRLRYGLEFCATLFEARRVRRYLKVLRGLQDALGAVTDATMAMRALAAAPRRDAATLFALGWLTAHRVQLVAQAAPALRRYGRVRPFWK